MTERRAGLLGKQAATYDKRDLCFAHYQAKTVFKEAPVKFGHASLVQNPWAMLANDRLGDCAIAGPGHEHMLTSAAAGKQITFTDEAIISAYSAITGYNPADPATDQGSNVRDVLKYRQATGLTDAAGTVHKIGAYVALETGNWEQLLQALYLFDAVGIGIQFPSSAMDQFNAGKPWSVVAGSSIEGEHYIPVIGRQSTSDAVCVTWGATQKLTKTFYEKFNDESWAILSPEAIGGTGKTLEGFDLAALQSDLAAL